MTGPLEHERDLEQVVDDVELIAPWVLLLASAVIGAVATSGLHLLIFGAPLQLALFLTDLTWK